MQVLELWWFGLGAIGAFLTVRFLLAPQRGLRIAPLRLAWITSSASVAGPILIILIVAYVVDPIGVGMFLDDVMRRPKPKRGPAHMLAAMAIGPTIVLVLGWSLVVAPLLSR